MKQYKYIEPEERKQQLTQVLERGLGRKLDELEQRKIKWISDCEYETSGVLLDWFIELSNKE